jgi:hypothetical protein
MDKKHIAIGVGVITFVATTLTIILIWMMNYQSDVVMSSPPSQSFRWQSLKPTHHTDPAENFTAEVPENTAKETIEQPEKRAIDQKKAAKEATEPSSTELSSSVPVVPEQPKIPWSQFNKSLLALEQEQSAIMTLLAQKYSSVVEPETKVVEPAAKVIEHNPKTVEIEPETPKTIIVAPNLKPVEIEPETPKTVATKTEIIATTAQPVKPAINTLTTTTEVAELTNLLGKKTVAKPLEVAWDKDLFMNLNSNTWLKVTQQILELEQWREKTIHSLSIKVERQGNQENNK